MTEGSAAVTLPEARSEEDRLLRRIWRVVALCRAVDERLWKLSRQGRSSFVLTARGHEVAQVASAAAMRPGVDSAWPYYRDMGVAFALGITPYELLLGAMGRAEDPHTGGRQLTMHLASPERRLGSISSVIADHIPHAVGAAYAAWVRREDSVALCWFGDGATSAGATHEAMNLAAARRLPVVFICENNGLAISVPQHLQTSLSSIADRAKGYAIPGVRVDGTDAVAVNAAAREAVERARSGGGPSLIEADVPRILAHSSQDDDAYRDRAALAAAAARDPLPRLERELIARGALTPEEARAERERFDRMVLADADRAWARPQPEPTRFSRWMFAGDEPHRAAPDIGPGPLPGGVFDD
jgi:2-oxoisovalerate dehydrogenase E1 component alpha subunit